MRHPKTYTTKLYQQQTITFDHFYINLPTNKNSSLRL